ncbi:uncharacterized protein [Solanum lycopersicum]|uniref:uncharacterized protein n=1 Tax=Solanum lycopersicum TaxID=4081 RepID=UPI003748819E
MAPYKALYGRRCRSPIEWFKVGEEGLIGPDLFHQAMEKVKVIQERLKTAQSCQKSYTNVRRIPYEFEVDDWIHLKVLPMKGVIRFAYELEIPQELAGVHPVFYISMLKKNMGDPSVIVPTENVEIKDILPYKEVQVYILDCQVRKLRTNEVAAVKVRWMNQLVEEATWEAEENMKKIYPHLLEFGENADQGTNFLLSTL